MTQIVVLNSRAHAALRVHAGASAQHGDNQRFVPVVVSEFAPLALHYPILLSKDAETGQFYCGAMLGFDVAENLFVQDHRTQAAYRPLNLQRGPFLTSGSDLAVDLDHPRVTPSGEQALFGETGESTPYLLSIMALMRTLATGAEQTKAFIAVLLALKLVESVSIEAQFDDGSRRDVAGLYTVNRDALRDLPDDAVIMLFRRGYLPLIHHLLASLSHVSTLAQKKNRQFLPGAGGTS